MTPEEAIARQSIARAVEIARERIARGRYLKDDGETLEAACADAEAAFERLGYSIRALAEERPYLGVEAWHALDMLVATTMTIGGLSTISQSGKKLVASHNGKKGVPKSKTTRQAKAKARRVRALAIAEDVQDRRQSLSKSSLATAVKKRLGKRSVGTRSLRNYLTEREQNNRK
jgi:hypothetical protein